MKNVLKIVSLGLFTIILPADAAVLRTAPAASLPTINPVILVTSTKTEVISPPTYSRPSVQVIPSTAATFTPSIPSSQIAPAKQNVTLPSLTPVDVSKVRQRQMLNPQPEPPIPAIKNLLLNKPEIKNADGSTEVTIPNSLTTSSGETKLLIKPEFTTDGKQIFLRSKGIQVALNSVPSAVYQKLNYVFEKNNIKMLNKLTLDLENNNPMYSVQIEEPAKLFGIFPIKVKSTIKMDETGVVSQSGLPWYRWAVKKNIEAVADYAPLPNLVLKSVRFEPTTFSDGEAVDAYLTVANEGFEWATAFPDLKTQTCDQEQLYYNNGSNPAAWYCEIFAILPGESQEFVFPIYISCPSEAKFVFAPGSKYLKETTKDDNSLTMNLQCK